MTKLYRSVQDSLIYSLKGHAEFLRGSGETTTPDLPDLLDAAVAELNRLQTALDDVISKASDPLVKLGGYLASLLDEDCWATAEQFLNAAAVEAASLREEQDALKEAVTRCCTPSKTEEN